MAKEHKYSIIFLIFTFCDRQLVVILWGMSLFPPCVVLGGVNSNELPLWCKKGTHFLTSAAQRKLHGLFYFRVCGFLGTQETQVCVCVCAQAFHGRFPLIKWNQANICWSASLVSHWSYKFKVKSASDGFFNRPDFIGTWESPICGRKCCLCKSHITRIMSDSRGLKHTAQWRVESSWVFHLIPIKMVFRAAVKIELIKKLNLKTNSSVLPPGG